MDVLLLSCQGMGFGGAFRPGTEVAVDFDPGSSCRLDIATECDRVRCAMERSSLHRAAASESCRNIMQRQEDVRLHLCFSRWLAGHFFSRRTSQHIHYMLMQASADGDRSFLAQHESSP